MRGQDALIAQRLQRRAPAIVFVNDYPCRTDWFESHEQATLCTHGDAIDLLDLRCLVGLRVSISALSAERAQALFERACACGAAVVAAVQIQPERHPTEQQGWCQIYRKENSNG